MFRAQNRGGNWFVETDEVAPLEYLRGLPRSGDGWPWANQLNGEAVGGNDDPNFMLVAPGFDRQTATAFEVDDEAHYRALALSSAFVTATDADREHVAALIRRGVAEA